MFPKRQIYPAKGECLGICYVIHGLNQKPALMEPLIDELNQMGVECELLCLAGHRDGEYDELKTLDANTWLAESVELMQDVQKRADKEGVPLFAMGYSLGSLVMMEALRCDELLRLPDRACFFAPAIALQPRAFLLKVIAPFVRWVPSFSPAHLRAQKRGMPIQPYKALFDLHQRVNGTWNKRLSKLQALLILDPEDELVSYRSLIKIIEDRKWYSSRLVWSATDEKVENSFHHLITSPDYVRKEQWGEMIELMKEQFFDDLLPADLSFNAWLNNQYEYNWQRCQTNNEQKMRSSKASFDELLRRRGWCKPST